MRTCWTFLAVVLFTWSGVSVRSQEPVLPPGEKEPLLRLEAGGPTSYVTALAFSTDGKLLYAGGWDKVVRVWRRGAPGKFVLDPLAYRVPLGPGLGGAINTIALSEDGIWLAVAGRGPFRGEAGFRQNGWIWPSDGALTSLMRRDQGTIYVFNTQTQAVHLLRGHRGPVLSLAFAPSRQGTPPLLVSAAGDWDADAGHYGGTLRLWEVEQSKYLDGITVAKSWKSEDQNIVPPGLSAWYTGAAPRQLRVASAWGDGAFRVWDVERTKDRTWSVKDLRDNTTVAHDPERNITVTAGYGIRKARLTLWGGRPGQEPRASPLPPVPADQVDSFPRALGFVSTQANARADAAAVVVAVRKGESAEHRLQLLNLGGNNFGEVRADVTLWTGLNRRPVLATAPRSSYLAVAGNDEHQILIYSIQDLLQQQGEAQRLRSSGTAFHFAAFVSKGKELGLLLNETAGKEPGQPPRAAAAGDFIFDFAQRALTADRTGWSLAAPTLDGWRAERRTEQGRAVVAVFQAERLVRRIRLKANQVMTDFALLPPRPALNVPILAMAWHQGGQPVLCLYNAATGEQVRHLTGHQGLIYCLAFSADGRFLVSTAEDQTVCLWSLNNLVKLIGHYGQLPGVALREDQDSLQISQVQDDSPVRDQLHQGDHLEGLVEGNQVRPLKSLKDYYAMIALLKPGQTVTLNVRGRQGTQPVRLAVGQGIDERKPLLSLFITRESKLAAREWIGWNPIGPYDASGRKAERHLGWHFNTGRADGPTRFAVADQYRKDYYREGLLKALIAQGELQRVPPAPPLPPPEMGLVIEEQGTYPETDPQGQILVRHANVALRLAITGRPVNSLASLTWKVDEQAEQKLALENAPANELTVPLQLQRGVHRVRVTARTPETGRREFVQELCLRYQPPPPHVDWKGSKAPLVRESAFTLEAEVRPGESAEAVQIDLTYQHGNLAVLRDSKTYTLHAGQPLALRKQLTLQPGNNVIEILARNQQALRGYEEAETARLAVEVTLLKQASPPRIVLESVLPHGSDKSQASTIEPGKTVRVQVPKIWIRGKMTAAEGENLANAEWVKEPSTQATGLVNFMPGKDSQLLINEEVSLQPGLQTLRFRAKTATSDEAERPLTVYYQPPVPSVEVLSPQRGGVRYGERDSVKIDVQARLGAASPAYPYQAKILLDGQEVADPSLAIIQKEGRLTAQVAIHPGNNRLQVQLRNAWGSVFTTDDIHVAYLRPPEVLELKAPPETKEPFLDVTARVRSALPLLLESVIVEVNGKRRDIKPVLAEQVSADGTRVVLLQNVPLDADQQANEVSVRLANAEAECCMPGTANIRYRPMKPPPVVDFVQPRENSVVEQPRLKVRFQVRSGSPLKKVQWIQQGSQPVAVDLAKLRSNPDGSAELNEEIEAHLRRGLNELRVVAANSAGEQEAVLNLNFPYRPVQLVVDSLDPIGSGSKPVHASVLPGGALAFPEMPEARVEIRGHVVWDEEDDARLKKATLVRVFVNGFQQLPAILEPAAGESRERRFRTSLLLNQAKENLVEIALPGLELDAANRTQFLVQCTHPARAQHLHLLLACLDEEEGKGLKTQFLNVFGPVFDGVDVYGPQVGYRAGRAYVLEQLDKIRYHIQGLANARFPSNNVVVFYYQGSESVNAQGNFFSASLNAAHAGEPRGALTCDDLAKFVERTPGAHVLFLDVERLSTPTAMAKDKVSGWSDNYPDSESHLAVLRYAWLSRAQRPKDQRLLQALREAIPQATRLVEVTEQLSRFASRSKYFPESLQVDEHVAQELKDLSFRKQR